jgi:hypothetical protein
MFAVALTNDDTCVPHSFNLQATTRKARQQWAQQLLQSCRPAAVICTAVLHAISVEIDPI